MMATFLKLPLNNFIVFPKVTKKGDHMVRFDVFKKVQVSGYLYKGNCYATMMSI